MILSPVPLLAASLALLALASLAGLLSRSGDPRPALSLALTGLTLAGFVGAWGLVLGARWTLTLSVPGLVPSAPGPELLVLAGSGLTSIFLLLLGVVGGAVVLASFGYVARYVHERRASLSGLLALFLLCMVLVVAAGSVFLFLVAWEGMTLVSYLLVVHEHDSWEVRRAGLLYLVMSHAAAAGVFVALLLLGTGTGRWSFAGIAAVSGGLDPWWTGAVFLAALVGFGTKAGLAPLHVWLPEAHPAAPSNVSALMSGVMIKLGVYGTILVTFELLPGPPPLWWGLVLLALGGLSCLMGVLNAIAQHDLKRLLAFHSIENIGIIYLALGTALVFLSLGSPGFAALALLAAVLHTWNHGLFKSLLFLGAGAATGEAGSRDMDRLGGLLRPMPATGLLFLGGAMAISALPPLNGFVSEWLLFQALFGGFSTGSLPTEVAFTIEAGVLALSSGLAAYCFVKAFGATFLARPRSDPAKTVHRDAPPSMLLGMGLLCGLCLLLGIAPFLLVGPIASWAAPMVGSGPLTPAGFGALGALPRPDGSGGSLAMGVVALGLSLTIGAGWLLRRVGASRSTATRPAWDCGLDQTSSRMEYTASGYAQPVLRLFNRFYQIGAHDVTRGAGAARTGVLAKAGSVDVEIEYPLLQRGYRPLAAGIESLARGVSRFQSGGIHAYLGYLALTLIGLLLLLRAVGGATP